MNKLILPLALASLTISTQVLADEISIIKPLWGYHYSERNFNGKDWNDNYLDSLGLGYRLDSGFGVSATYVHENSVNNPAWYLHAEYMHPINDWLDVGFAGGLRNGYGKKSANRSDSDFIPSGAFQIEAYSMLLQVTDRVSVINYKYDFDYDR